MITLPSTPKVVSEEGNSAVFEIEGLHPGYGQTIGNSLRRVLLSSLKGAAITAVKIEGVRHEFSTIEGMMEDVIDFMLNLKQMRFRVTGEGPFTISLSVNGEKEVRGKDFKTPSQVEVVTPDLHIATLTAKKSSLVLEATVESGLGYTPQEARSKEKVDVGTVALDAIFSPVRKANYEVENMRVGDRTDYNKIRLFVETDGSVSPREAFAEAADILVKQFTALAAGFSEGLPPESSRMSVKESVSDETEEDHDEKGDSEDEVLKMKLDELKQLSSRTLNVLREAGVKTVGGLSRKKESTIREIEGLGEKGIQEIKKALGTFGITLKQ